MKVGFVFNAEMCCFLEERYFLGGSCPLEIYENPLVPELLNVVKVFTKRNPCFYVIVILK